MSEVQLAAWRKAGERIVFTNGVFDILHAGHVMYLAEAKSRGERLVVGLNSDESVRTLGKGPERPSIRKPIARRCLKGFELWTWWSFSKSPRPSD